MADEPSIPMDQEEEDNDEYFSARESPGKQSGKAPTTTPQRSSRDGPQQSGKSKRQSKKFFSDEIGQSGSEASAKKSEKVRSMLKDRNRWDMREYKKEELEPVAKPKKKKKKKVSSKTKKQLNETEEKSKTDEESEEKDEKDEGEPSASPDRTTPQARSFFQNEQLILRCNLDKPIAPKCKYSVLRFGKSQEVVEYDAEGVQHLLGHYNERAISNPWRRWGAHLALCGQGGFMVDKNKKIVEIKRGSDPPPCPPNPRQITLNKNCEAPDSQTLMGTIKVEAGQAEDEVHRIGRVMEEYVRNGGFVPPAMTRKEMAPKAKGGKPQVVVQVKGGKPKNPSAEKMKATKKTSKTKKEEDSQTDDDSVAEKAKKKEAVVKEVKVPEVKDSSKRGGGFSFFKRKKTSTTKGKGNKGSIR